MSTFRIPIRRARRATTLPPVQRTTPVEMTGLGSLYRSMMADFAASQRDLNRAHARMLFPEADPWDEAVRSIERRAAAKAEWPFPW